MRRQMLYTLICFCVYFGLDVKGTDERGRPIMIFVASRMPENDVEMEKVFLYILKLMEEVTAKNLDYYAIYIHTNMSGKSKPSFSWLKRLYGILNDRYKCFVFL
jgi:hypothetical protein